MVGNASLIRSWKCCPLFRKSNLSERVALPSLCWPSIGPLQDGVKRRTKGLAPLCQTVFNLRRHLRIGRTHNDSVRCQAAELLPQHFLSDVGHRSFQIGEAHHLASEQMEQNHELPSSFQETERCFYVCRSGCGRIAFQHRYPLTHFLVRTSYFLSMMRNS